jgi:hypothetical protein
MAFDLKSPFLGGLKQQIGTIQGDDSAQRL